MKFLILAAVLLLAAPKWASAQASGSADSGGGKSTEPSKENCGLIYGQNHALTVCAPDGWTLDNSILNDEGVYAVFYPNGSTFMQAKTAGSFMYVNVVGKDANSTLAKMMADDANNVKKETPTAVIKKGDAILVGQSSVPVQLFEPGGFKRYEATAYINEEKVLAMIVITSSSQANLDKDYPSFMKLVQTFKFLGSNVTIQHK